MIDDDARVGSHPAVEIVESPKVCVHIIQRIRLGNDREAHCRGHDTYLSIPTTVVAVL